MQDFLKLKVWEKAHLLAMDVYRLSARFPRRDGVTVKSQLRRAALSVPSTIVEGAGKLSGAEFCRYLDMALGSASETHYHLIVARDLGLLANAKYDELATRIAEIRRMLTGLIKRVRLANAKQPPPIVEEPPSCEPPPAEGEPENDSVD